jgi:hypothetical protein
MRLLRYAPPAPSTCFKYASGVPGRKLGIHNRLHLLVTNPCEKGGLIDSAVDHQSERARS